MKGFRRLGPAIGVGVYPGDISGLFRNWLAEGVTLDEALRELRSAGASLPECIRATKHVCGFDLREAERWVHDSTAGAEVNAPSGSN